MRSPASDSRKGRMRGMPPATDASNRKSTPAPSAVSNSERPCIASSSLLAVTTGLPAMSASTMSERAGSTPPITSTTMSTSGSFTKPSTSSVKQLEGSGRPRSRPTSRTATRVISSGTPERVSITSALSCTSRPSALPTLPHPRIPTRTLSSTALASHLRHVVTDEEVVEGLASDDDTRVAVAHEHHGRSLQEVVIRRRRVRVRARHRHGEDVVDRDSRRQPGVPYEDVALLAVLARNRRDGRSRVGGARREERLVAGAVGDRPGVVAHPAVHRHVGADPRHLLDRADGVDGEAGGPGDGTARFDAQPRRGVDAGGTTRVAVCPAHAA